MLHRLRTAPVSESLLASPGVVMQSANRINVVFLILKLLITDYSEDGK